MSVFLLLAAQLSPMLSADDRAAFEPYRQCVLSIARKGYPTGASLKAIFAKAKSACNAEEAAATADLAIASAQETIASLSSGKDQPVLVNRIGILDHELLLELADEFVPKAK